MHWFGLGGMAFIAVLDQQRTDLPLEMLVTLGIPRGILGEGKIGSKANQKKKNNQRNDWLFLFLIKSAELPR
jgi:hypothetical protein